MESLLSSITDDGMPALTSASPGRITAIADAAALQSLSPQSQTDTVSFDFSELYKGLTVTARKIVDSLNELLKEKLPDGLQSLKPADVTPEATADRIVSQVTSGFAAYRKQHSDLSDDEILSRFMHAVRSGVDEGYNDAARILEGLGAFEFDGIEDGIKQTKKLIEEKLNAFEKTMRQQLGLDPAEEADEAASVKEEILAQGGASLLQVTA